MVLGIKKPIIGMIHIQATPGAPKNELSPDKIIYQALKEAKILSENGIDAIAIENMHDIPYLKNSVGSEVVSLMAIIGYEIKKEYKIPCGIQVLAAANKQALAIAHSAGLDFIRAEGFVFGHIADEGYIDANAGELLRYRKNIGAENVKIFTDIKKKHSSHLITADISLSDTAKTAEFFNSDGVIVTGAFTGSTPHEMELKEVNKSVKIPVIIGSGITPENLEKYFHLTDAFIVGTYYKYDGDWKNEPDPTKVNSLTSKAIKLRN